MAPPPPTWKGDRIPQYSPQVNTNTERGQMDLSYTMPTLNQTANNGNGQNPTTMTPTQTSPPSSYPPPPPPGPSMNPPYGNWSRDNMGWDAYGTSARTGSGTGNIQMNGQPMPNQWMPQHLNNPNASFPNLPNHMPVAQNGHGFSNSFGTLRTASSPEQFHETGTGSSSTPSDYRESSQSAATPRILKRVGHKGRPRVGANNDQNGHRSAVNGRPLPLKWHKGIREKPIPNDATPEEKEELKVYNRRVGQARKEHTREQNRVSAQKSRQRKQVNLEKAQARAEMLGRQLAGAQEMVQTQHNTISHQRSVIQALQMHICQLTSDPRLRTFDGNGYPTAVNLQVQGPSPLPNAAGQYPTPTPGSLSSPATAASAQAPNPMQFQGFMQPGQASLPMPNSTLYAQQSLMHPQGAMQPQSSSQPLKFEEGQGSTTQMGAAYGGYNFSVFGGNPQQGNDPVNFQGELQGNLHDGIQENHHEDLHDTPQNGFTVVPHQHAHGPFLGNPTMQEQERQQQQPNEDRPEMLDPALESMDTDYQQQSPSQDPPSNSD